jgi:hypothetical protein
MAWIGLRKAVSGRDSRRKWARSRRPEIVVDPAVRERHDNRCPFGAASIR